MVTTQTGGGPYIVFKIKKPPTLGLLLAFFMFGGTLALRMGFDPGVGYNVILFIFYARLPY